MAPQVLTRSLRLLLLAAAIVVSSGCALFRSPTYVADADDPGTPDGTPLIVTFEGAESIAEFRLRRAIEDRIYDLSRRPDSEAVLQDAEFDLELRYRTEGFADAKADGDVLPRAEDADEDEPREVRFVVEEGRRWTLGEIELVGVERIGAEDRERLDGLLIRRYSDTFGLDDPLFVESDLEGWTSSIAIYLKSHGYLDAEVAAPTFGRDTDTAEVAVRIEVRPGPRYVFADVGLAPDIAATLPEDQRPPPPARGSPAIATVVEDYRADVLRALRHTGHPEARVSVQLTRRTDAKQVDLVVDGTAGPRARIADVRIRGLEQTRRSVVASRLGFDVGGRFDGDQVDTALRELYRTGLFRRVEIDHRWLGAPPDADGGGPVQMLVAIEERDSRTVEAMLGYGSYERARGKLRFEETNLFGTGKALTIEGRVSTRGERGLAQITDPALFGTRNVLSVSADAYRRQWPTFDDQAWGGTIALTRDILDRLTARVGYTLRLHTEAENRVEGAETQIGDYVEGAVFVEARYEARDSLLYPRDGYQANIRIDRNDDSLGADIEFLRAQIGLSYYVPVSRRASLAFRADTGAIWPEDGNSIVPLQERLFNGGENTVRSFREYQLGPKDSEGRPLGGQYRNIFSVELRTRVARLLETSLFVDAGNVGTSVDDLSFSDMRYGLGGGLRVPLPIGPIRVDAAWNPDQRPGDREWTVHISVGYPF